jgi:Tol biopolymer transport system component
LAGTEDAAFPFWSPDSRSIGFLAKNTLKRVDIAGGTPQTLFVGASNGSGGTWGSDGVILFGRSGTITGPENQLAPLLRIPAAGGEAVAVTKLDTRRQTGHLFPQFLPGGRQFIFYVTGQPDAQGIYLGSLDTAEIRRLTAADTAGRYVQGWLFYIRQGALVARRLDTARGELMGDPVTVADSVAVDARTLAGAFSVSAAGLIAYRASGGIRRQLAWFDRTGKALGTVGPPDENTLLNPALAPDGRRIVIERTVQSNRDLWVLDGDHMTRLTFDPSNDGYPIWSPDGNRIVFFSARKGTATLYETSPGGAGSETLLVGSEEKQYPTGWSSDGRFVAYSQFGSPGPGIHLGVLTMTGERKSQLFLKTDFDTHGGQFSPDGSWMAYQSNESGRFEVYVRPFPGPGSQWQVSTDGGTGPRWRTDGRELYYLAPDGKLMAASITTHGTRIESGPPTPLFSPRIVSSQGTPLAQYDVARDGRFLINVTTEDAVTPPITLIQNWKPPAR